MHSVNGLMASEIVGNSSIAITTFPDTSNFDAFGRFRVSQITSLMDVKLLGDAGDSIIDTVSGGGGLTTYDIDDSSITLSTASDGDYIIRQTFQVNPYQAGKSQSILMTFSGFQPETNVTKRIGYYNSTTISPYASGHDGLFLESSNSEVSINIYHNGVATESTAQSQFNLDKLDGTGASGITVDWSKCQIIAIDFEWLGVGRVRWGLNIDGITVPFHESLHANNTLTVPYMRSPNKPLRWEIRQAGAGSGSFKQICGTVGTEGGLNVLGDINSVNNGITPVIGTADTRHALLGIRLRDDYTEKIASLTELSVFGSTKDDRFLWELRLNPTVASTFTYSDYENSGVQVAVGVAANIVSGGRLIQSGYAESRNSLDIIIKNSRKIGVSIDGTKDELVLCATPISTGASIFGSITWVEND